MATCKLGEKGCWKDGKCHYRRDCENKVLTNADRIRAMTDEDLAKNIIQYRDDWGDYVTPDCEFYDTYKEAVEATIKWLQQPAEGE